MLVLTRRVGESIQIGDDITITVVRVEDHRASLGISAPAHICIKREELAAGWDSGLKLDLGVKGQKSK